MPSRLRSRIGIFDSNFSFFTDTATTEIYTLSLHDALPISTAPRCSPSTWSRPKPATPRSRAQSRDRKSTRLNSSHGYISYAVFCLKKKKTKKKFDENKKKKKTRYINEQITF